MRADYKILALLLLAAIVSYVVCEDADGDEELSTGYSNGGSYYSRNRVGYSRHVSGYHGSGYARGYYSGYQGSHGGSGYNARYGYSGRGRHGYAPMY